MDATALQCLCRAWARVRSWEEPRSRAPLPISLSLLGRGHTPGSSQNDCRGLGPPAVSNHFTVPPVPSDTVPYPQCNHQVQRGCSNPGTFPQGHQCPVWLHHRCNRCAGSFEEEESPKEPILFWGRCVQQTNFMGVLSRSSLRGGQPATGPYVETGIEPTTSNQQKWLLSGQL